MSHCDSVNAGLRAAAQEVTLGGGKEAKADQNSGQQANEKQSHPIRLLGGGARFALMTKTYFRAGDPLVAQKH